MLKAENLQRTGSFKLRGALAKIAALGDAARAGVVTGSAGNHAQAVAYAARTRGVPCEVFMPDDRADRQGRGGGQPRRHASSDRRHGRRLRGRGQERAAAEAGLAFVHPFDDPDVIAGQGTLGLELLEQVPELARVVVPVGGGGLVSAGSRSR